MPEEKEKNNSAITGDIAVPAGPLYWSRAKRPSLQGIFNHAAQTLPDMAGATLLGAGAFGLVADHGDGTVSKICLRYKDLMPGMNPLQTALSEVRALQALRRHWPDGDLGGLKVPVLIGEAEPLPEDSPFLLSYRMTKLAGTARTWHMPEPDPQEESRNKVVDFEQAGAALARFHGAVRGLDLPVAVHSDGHRPDRILAIPHMSARINEGLARAQDFLDAHKIPGIVHGDFHGGNIMAADDGRVTGVVDMSMMGASDNVISDFSSVPPDYIKVFTAAYESISGAAVNPDIITALSLVWLTRDAGHRRDDPAAMTELTENINERLGRLTFATGFKP